MMLGWSKFKYLLKSKALHNKLIHSHHIDLFWNNEVQLYFRLSYERPNSLSLNIGNYFDLFESNFIKFALLTKFHLSSSSSFKNGHIVITAYHHLWWLPVLFILIFIHNLTPLPSGSYESILTWNPFLHLHLCIKSQAWLRILFTTLRSIFKEYFIVWLASVFKLYLNRRFIPFLLFLLLLSLTLQLKN